jgi:hypothetical protein
VSWPGTFSSIYPYTPYGHELVLKNNHTGGTNTWAGIFFYAGDTTEGTNINAARIAAVRDGNTNAHLVFATRGSTTGHTEKMRIEGNGNVGIGTSSPLAKLDVSTTANDGVDVLAWDTTQAQGANLRLGHSLNIG